MARAKKAVKTTAAPKTKKTAKQPASKKASETTKRESQAVLVARAFGKTAKGRTIEEVGSLLTEQGLKLNDKQIRSALDRVRARGGTVTAHGGRAFSVSL